MKGENGFHETGLKNMIPIRSLIVPISIIFLLCLHPSYALPETIKIGGLFDVSDHLEETAFRHAVERINEDQNILPRYRLSAQWERIPEGDSFHASKKVCQLLNDGVASIIGPQTPSSVSYVQSVCDAMEIPQIETTENFRTLRPSYGINLYPHSSILTRAYADVVKAWGWNKYIIIYENDESLIRLQEIMKQTDPASTLMNVKQLPDDTDDYRPLFKSLLKHSDISNLIVDCSPLKLDKVLQDAEDTGMLKDKRYFLTTLDIHALSPQKFANMDVNITSIRLVDPANPKVQSVVDQWRSLVDYGFPKTTGFSPQYYFDDSAFSSRTRSNSRTPAASDKIDALPNNALLTKAALIYDAVELVAKALHVLDMSQPQRIETQSLNCKKQNSWAHGSLALEALRRTRIEGTTGMVDLDALTGSRIDVQFDVMELTRKGLFKIGVWNPRLPERLNWTRTAQETRKQQEEELKNRSLIVTTRLGEPYCMEDPPKSGNFSGFVVDLVHELATELQFRYEIKEVSDGGYGSLDNKTGLWNGMIGDILEGRADIAVGDLTINHDREAAVDFTMPFMNLGISILYQKPEKKKSSLFSFMDPFSPDVWIYTLTAFLGVSLLLSVLSRCSPYDWSEPAPCAPAFGQEVENQFNLINSLWFSVGSLMQQGCDFLPKITPIDWVNPTPFKEAEEFENIMGLPNGLWFSIGSLMQQGSDIAPRAMSTRTVAGMWWFFTLIMISSYTANLAAFLTSEGMEEGISGVESLPSQSKVKYGCLGSGTTAKFFRENTFPLYKEIWNSMENMKPSPFVKKTDEGINRVLQAQGRYAFFMESVGIEYITQRDCKLTQLGGLLDSKGYGIALRKNSPYRELINQKVLEFQEKGVLNKLKRRWWIEKGGGQCPAAQVAMGGATPLSMQNVGGCFVVLLGGCILAVFMAVIEFLWKGRKLGMAEHEDDMWTEMKKELKFAMKFQAEKKPVKKGKPPSLTGSVPILGYNSRKESSE